MNLCLLLSVAAGLPSSVEDVRAPAGPVRYDFGAARSALSAAADQAVERRSSASDAGVLLEGTNAYVHEIARTHAACRTHELVAGRSTWPRLRFSERRDVEVRWQPIAGGVFANVASAQMLATRALLTALPTEYVVDDDGGPGVDFTEIADALAVAQDGDLVTVRAGFYAPFVLERGVSIIGEGTASSVAGVSIVRFVPAGSVAVIASLKMESCCAVRGLSIESCDGTVVVERSVIMELDIDASVDVRVHDCEIDDGYSRVEVTSSRTEFVNCSIRGTYGSFASDYCTFDGGPGGAGISMSGGKLHVVRSQVRGGKGGDATCYYCSSSYAGPGGPGIRLDDGYAVVAGESIHAIEGGLSGWNCPGYLGYASGAVVDSGALRSSGVDLPAPEIENNGGTVALPPIPDPTLELVGEPGAGQPVTLVVRGNPGGATRVFLSRTPIVEGGPGSVIERLVPFDIGVDLGNMPGTGVATYSFTVPPRPAPGGPVFGAWLQATDALPLGRLRRGTVLFAQGTVFTGGQNIRTNSVPIVIR